jgi:hypothetical protein
MSGWRRPGKSRNRSTTGISSRQLLNLPWCGNGLPLHEKPVCGGEGGGLPGE